MPEPPPVPPAAPDGAAFDQSDLRKPPAAPERLPERLPDDPLPLLLSWFNEATAGSHPPVPNPSAMTLATIDPGGRPSARMMLCKAIDAERGFVVLYTNTHGRKAAALRAHPWAALVMHWDWLDRQVRIEGPVVPTPADESDAYFASRPWASRIGAWASDQSQPIPSRQAMLDKVAQTMRRFGLDPDNPPRDDAIIDIPRPPHWGGYRIFIEKIELWTSGAGRVHDRGVWERELTPDGPHLFRCGPWRSMRLQP
jgi:pyridoxamine 5'-phosphate oxidase